MHYSQPFQAIDQFEKLVAEYFGAPYGVAVDCCTHAIELALRIEDADRFTYEIPYWTYVSVPMKLTSLRWNWRWVNNPWEQRYRISPRVIDAAADWSANSYEPNTMLCVSFGFKKHINIGRGGMILLDDYAEAVALRRMRYDGRRIHQGVMYNDEKFTSIGYHYYMTPEQAEIGAKIFYARENIPAKPVSWRDYPSLSTHPIFEKQLYLNDRPTLQ